MKSDLSHLVARSQPLQHILIKHKFVSELYPNTVFPIWIHESRRTSRSQRVKVDALANLHADCSQERICHGDKTGWNVRIYHLLYLKKKLTTL